MEKEKPKVVIASVDDLSAHILAELKARDLEVVVINDDLPKKPIKPVQEPIKVFPESDRRRKLKKDKTHLKRYSSYFNKKSK